MLWCGSKNWPLLFARVSQTTQCSNADRVWRDLSWRLYYRFIVEPDCERIAENRWAFDKSPRQQYGGTSQWPVAPEFAQTCITVKRDGKLLVSSALHIAVQNWEIVWCWMNVHWVFDWFLLASFCTGYYCALLVEYFLHRRWFYKVRRFYRAVILTIGKATVRCYVKVIVLMWVLIYWHRWRFPLCLFGYFLFIAKLIVVTYNF